MWTGQAEKEEWKGKGKGRGGVFEIPCIPTIEHKCPGPDINQLFQEKEGRVPHYPSASMYREMVAVKHIQANFGFCLITTEQRRLPIHAAS